MKKSQRRAHTSTVNSFVVAIFTVPGSVAEFVEMNTFTRPDALYVIERTSDRHFLCTWGRETKQSEKSENPFISTLIIHVPM